MGNVNGNERKRDRTKTRMINFMYSVRLQLKFTNTEVRNNLGIYCVGDILTNFCWFGRVE
jgi:hypothetical protein